MKNSLRQFQLQKMDQFLAKIPLFERPTHGWIHTIRKLLNMKTDQLSKRMGVSQQAISQFEKQELQSTITLKTLHSAAQALECKFVYAFIPIERSLQDTIQKKAYLKAKKSMPIETKDSDRAVKLATEILKNCNPQLWD